MSTVLLSDQNVREKQALVVSKRRQYSDLDLRLLPVIKNDIVPLVDIDAVKASVRNIVLTNYGERPFQPNLGANLRALLFEPADQFSNFAITSNIKFALEKFEPRITNIAISVSFSESDNRYTVIVMFRVISLNQNVDMSIRLERLR